MTVSGTGTMVVPAGLTTGVLLSATNNGVTLSGSQNITGNVSVTATGSNGFGVVTVSGRSLVPWPPTRMIASIAVPLVTSVSRRSRGCRTPGAPRRSPPR